MIFLIFITFVELTYAYSTHLPYGSNPYVWVYTYADKLKFADRFILIPLYACNLFMCIGILIRLRNKRTSEDLKRKILSRHMKYFGWYSLVLAYSLMFINEIPFQNITGRFVTGNTGKKDYRFVDDGPPEKIKEVQDWYEFVNIILFNLPGTPIALLRITEPYVWQEIVKQWNILTCQK